MLITFSGLDGAGKSTLIEFVRQMLERQRRPVAVLRLNDQVGVYAWLRAMRDIVQGRRARELPPGMPDPRSRHKDHGRGVRGTLSRLRYALLWNDTLRRLIYPVDLFVFLIYRTYLERIRGRVLIMDRYFYDTLVDVSDGERRLWTRLLEAVTPLPTLPVFLDVSPEESHRRKGEFSVRYLHRRYEAYHRVFARVPGAVWIANGDLEQTKTVLLRAINDRNGTS